MKTIVEKIQIPVLLLLALFSGLRSFGQAKYIELDTTTSFTEYNAKETVDPCDKDTTITFRQGTRLTMNRCEYLRIADCFRLTEYNLDTTLQRGKMTTTTDDRKPLYSGGMVDIRFCGDCLEKPAIVQIPASKECAPGRMSLWTGTGDDDWVPDKPALVRTVRLFGIDYYEFKVRCSGAKNVAMLAPIADEVKFVMHDNELEITEIRISYGCPNGLFRAQRSHGSKMVLMNLPCPSDGPMIYAKAVSEAGDTLTMNYQPLNDLTRSGAITTCKAILKKDRKVKDKNVLYKKYTLYRRDFEYKPTVQAE